MRRWDSKEGPKKLQKIVADRGEIAKHRVDENTRPAANGRPGLTHLGRRRIHFSWNQAKPIVPEPVCEIRGR